jgi:hypothetical protein
LCESLKIASKKSLVSFSLYFVFRQGNPLIKAKSVRKGWMNKRH